MTVTRLIVPWILAIFALTLTACSPEDPFIQTPPNKSTISNPAYLRVIHGAVDAPSVDVLVGGASFFSGPQGYLEFPTGINDARYYPVDTSSADIVFRAGTNVLASNQLTLKKGQYYTAYLHSTLSGYSVLVTRDTLFPKPSLSISRIRAVNLAPDAPPFSIYIGSETDPPVFTNVAAGTASDYVVSPSYPITGPATSMWVKDNVGKTLFYSPTVFLSGASVLTLLVSGNAQPQGDEPFLTLTPLQENAMIVSSGDTLYGSPPLYPIKVAAVRFVNLVPTYPTLGQEQEKDSALEIAFYDPADQNYADNEFFRRNFPGQQISMLNVIPLGYYNLGVPTVIKPHLFLNTNRTLDNKQGYFPYRVEVNRKKGDAGLLGANPVLVPGSRTAAGLDLTVQAGKRYTIVAFGPFERGKAQSVVVTDNSPLPSDGMASVRLFHGAFDELKDKSLKLRVNGAVGPAIQYGNVPTRNDAFAVQAGDVTLELLNEAGDVVHTQPNIHLDAGQAYTVYLSQGPDGKALYLTPVPEAIQFQ